MRVMLFFDFISYTKQLNEKQLKFEDFEVILEYLVNPQEGRYLINQYVYFGTHPHSPYTYQKEINQLKQLGFIEKPSEGFLKDDDINYDYEVNMTIQMLHSSINIKPDVIVLLSDNSKLISTVDYLKDYGIRVEITSFGSSKLASHASGFIDLNVILIES